MKPFDSSTETLLISYLTLRKAVGMLGIVLPVVLIFGAMILEGSAEIHSSVSAYYHTCMRNVLVGTLCSVALFLFSYHGYDRRDRTASFLAGLFALGVVFFPTHKESEGANLVSYLHYAFAGFFFIVLSYMSICLFTLSNNPVTPEKKKRNRVYRFCGAVMLLSIFIIGLDNIPAVDAIISPIHPVLTFEFVALWAFGISWLIKGEFLLKDRNAS